MAVRETALGAAQVDETCRRMQQELRRERLARLELSRLEHELEAADAALERWLQDERARCGTTTDVRLADVALQAARDSISWASQFRKHAPLRERRERLLMGLQGAQGAIRALRRAREQNVRSRRSGPNYAP